jgi:type IV pilus assembly protein PilW
MDMFRAMRRARGFTLVELLVALALGILVVGVAGSLYLANKQTFRQQDDASRVQETARAALDVLGQNIRLAGFVDVSDDFTRVRYLTNPANLLRLNKQDPTWNKDLLWQSFGSTAPYVGVQAVMGCDGNFTAGLTPPWSCAGGSMNSITVAYQARPSVIGTPSSVRTVVTPYLDTLGPYDPPTGQGGDCGARDVAGATANPSGPLAINRFYVDQATNRLMCVGNGNPAAGRPVAEGVENLQLFYGITPAAIGAAPMDASVGRYVSASSVPDWSKVLAVQVCLQLASPTQNVAPGATRYTDCAGTVQTPTDGRIRQLYRATFSLRNNVLTNADTLP